MKLMKSRAKTEVEELFQIIPNLKKKLYRAEYSMNGDILSMETKDTSIINYLKSKGFMEV